MECGIEVTMEYPGSSLKEQVRSFGRPLCLFCFHEPFADDLIDDRLHKRRADPITLPIAFAKVQNEEVIVLSVHLEFMDPSRQIGHGRGTPLVDLVVT